MNVQSKILLLVEDDREERENAKKIISDKGHRAAVASNLQDAQRILKQMHGKLGGILTDLHFPERTDQDATKPCGLAVVAEAVRLGIPVAICSNVDHHHADYLKVVVSVLAEAHPAKSIPFGMDSKDWAGAVDALCGLIGEQS